MADTPQIAPEAQAALDRAQARLEAGDLTAALSDCDAALQAAPQWAEANNLRGVVLDETERTDEAIASYQEALRRESGGAGHPEGCCCGVARGDPRRGGRSRRGARGQAVTRSITWAGACTRRSSRPSRPSCSLTCRPPAVTFNYGEGPSEPNASLLVPRCGKC